MQPSNNNEESLAHMRILLAHVIACSTAARVTQATHYEYDMLVLREACAIYGGGGDKHTQKSTRDIARLVQMRIAESAAASSRVAKMQRIEDSYEREVTALVLHMVQRPRVYVQACRLLDVSAAAPQQKNLRRYDAAEVSAAVMRRDASAEMLRQTFQMRALWKASLGQALTPLEVLLCDEHSAAYMGIAPQSHAYLRHKQDFVLRHALDKRSGGGCCRGCARRLNNNNNKGITCTRCKRVFFCSTRCEVQDACNHSTSHANECDLLLLTNREDDDKSKKNG